jgi:DNA-directed RNA polymerase beta subunit
MVLGDREVSDGSEEYTIPGLNLFTVFMNNDLTYEDGIAMSLSAANKFQYLCVKQVPIRNGPDVPVKGTKVSPMSKSWWQVPFEGTVVSSKFVSRDLTRLSVSFVGSPVNGDKFTTFHGQKGVVTIVTDELMPKVMGVTAELVIGSSVIIKRETPSQLIEAACGMYINNNNIEHHTLSPEQVIDRFRVSKGLRGTDDAYFMICKEYENEVVVPADEGREIVPERRHWVMKSNVATNRKVRVNCGVIRVMQSVFMASDKIYYTSKRSKDQSLSIANRLAEGGSASLGEMEMSQLEASGFKYCLQEFKDRSDACVVDICNLCNCVTIICQCEFETRKKHGTFKAISSLSAIKLMAGIKVCSGASTKLKPKLDKIVKNT